MNRFSLRVCLSIALFFSLSAAFAAESFTGYWKIDLRTAAERQRGAECGFAEFDLKQTGDEIVGTHSMATRDCGRVNDEGQVKGLVAGKIAFLVITSGRNDAIVSGIARLSGGKLLWRQRQEIRPGVPEGDSALILSSGTLVRTSR